MREVRVVFINLNCPSHNCRYIDSITHKTFPCLSFDHDDAFILGRHSLKKLVDYCGFDSMNRFTYIPTAVEEPYRVSHRYPGRVLVQVT